jgi:flagellar basal-body rod modification protein FlgD
MNVPPTAPASSLSSLSSSPSSTSTNSAASASSTTKTLDQLAGNFQNFLTLLTTQLKNQDPLSPMDSTQFTQQLVAFTGVEAQINANGKLDALIALGKQQGLTAAASFIGDQVTATSTQAAIDSNGPSSIGYNLPSQAGSVGIVISDSTGTAKRHLTGTAAKGDNVVTWNGKDDLGHALPSGAYSVAVQALDQTSKPISGVTQSIIGIVTNAAADTSGDTQLSIGAVTVPLTAVTSIKKGA